MMNVKEKYLELLKKSLLNEIYVENELRIFCLAEKKLLKKWSLIFGGIDFEKLHHIGKYFPEDLDTFKKNRFEGGLLTPGSRHLVYADTMIGRKRLLNIEHCLSVILEEKILGDVIECGVWKGGATIFMKAYLDTYESTDRVVWLADSFEGVPESTLAQDKYSDLSRKAYPGLAIPKDDVVKNFEKYDVSLDHVQFLEGWFKDTLPDAPIDKLALLRLDGDLYESTMDALQSLYHKLSPGGFIIIDDYKALPQCEEAVQEFRLQNTITEPIQKIDSEAVFWRKKF
ncbi:TylF/MycF/NovP-related O-methyltransferase [Roseivirga sp.]|uniref:TylF/MycF/NovP-related O-methyltransferase n=1 Tax=Roseivirga sp. TaxID=1964215 RepID=UPI003B8BAFD0